MAKTWLAELLERLDVSRKELGRRLGHASNGLVSQVCNGTKGIPEDAIEAWADALHLTGKDREDFIWRAILDHAPEAVRKKLASSDQLIAELTQRMEAYERQAQKRRRG